MGVQKGVERVTKVMMHDEDGQAQHEQEGKVEHEEGRAAVLAGDVGEAPDVA